MQEVEQRRSSCRGQGEDLTLNHRNTNTESRMLVLVFYFVRNTYTQPLGFATRQGDNSMSKSPSRIS